MIRLFLGYDTREILAWQVAVHSVMARASQTVSVAPVALAHLREVFTRAPDANQSTEFSFTRFLVPWLCDYQGWALFMDCDVLVLDDLARIWDQRDERYAVQVVKHDHRPRENVKFLGQVQTSYPKKNWSSVMLMNCARCTALSPEYVNTASGLDLHRFNWLENEELVGDLPARWNHLVDYDPELPVSEISALHYTSGGPWFAGYANCGYADAWRKELGRMTESLPAP